MMMKRYVRLYTLMISMFMNTQLVFAQPDQRLLDVWDISGRDPSKILNWCYIGYINSTVKALKDRINSPDEYERIFIKIGGVREIAKEAFLECDNSMKKAKLFSDDSPSYERAKYFVNIVARKENADFLAKCKSKYCVDFNKSIDY